jgi:GNAT superfamily N-acetyltransferase
VIKIRSYDNNTDLQNTLKLAKMMHEESKYRQIPFDEYATTQFLTTGINHLSVEGFVAEHHEDGLIGFICLESSPYVFANARTAIDIAVYIVPEYRASGAIALLVDKAEQWCKSHFIHSLVFGVTAPENVTRIDRVYKKLGYKSWGTLVRKEFR